MIKYKNTQYSKLLNYIFIAIIIAISVVSFFQINSKSLPLTPYLITISVLILILLMFYKLTITIDDEKFTATFGIGWIKKTILLKNIDTKAT